jgi:hypothetical protein
VEMFQNVLVNVGLKSAQVKINCQSFSRLTVSPSPNAFSDLKSNRAPQNGGELARGSFKIPKVIIVMCARMRGISDRYSFPEIWA